MKRQVCFSILLALGPMLAGCAIPRGATAAIDAAHRAVTANEQIVAVYHEAVMEGFREARAAHVTEAKHIVDELAVATQPSAGATTRPMVEAEVVKTGFDRLLANLEQVEARRDRFLELYRLARENNANAKEALFLAGDLVMRSSATEEELRDLLTQSLARLRTGQTQPTTGGAP